MTVWSQVIALVILLMGLICFVAWRLARAEANAGLKQQVDERTAQLSHKVVDLKIVNDDLNSAESQSQAIIDGIGEGLVIIDLDHRMYVFSACFYPESRILDIFSVVA